MKTESSSKLDKELQRPQISGLYLSQQSHPVLKMGTSSPSPGDEGNAQLAEETRHLNYIYFNTWILILLKLPLLPFTPISHTLHGQRTDR